MRDKAKQAAYWQGSLDEIVEVRSDMAAFLENDGLRFDQKIGEAYSLQLIDADWISALYSSGAAIEACAEQARSLLINTYPKFVAIGRENPKAAKTDYAGGWDFRTRYLALAVLCKLTPEESLPLVQALDFWPDRDALWEKFIVHLGHGAGREEINTLVWPDAYALALEMFDDDATDLTRQAALMRFDKGWLKEMRSGTNPFYSNMNNKNNTYVGYWNFEAAALAVIHNVDDLSLATSKTYPKDWADWAR